MTQAERDMIDQDPHPQSERGLGDLLLVVWRRKWILPLFLLLIVGPTVLYVLEFQPPVYASTGRVLADVPARTAKILNAPDLGSSYDVQTELEIMRSEGILRKAVNVLDLAREDHSWLRTLKLDLPEKARVMTVTGRGPTPEIARDFVNAVANGYVEQRRQRRIDEMMNSLSWLREQGADMKVKLLQAEEEFQKFKRVNSIPSLDRMREADLQRHKTLSDAYLQTQKLRIEAETELRAAERPSPKENEAAPAPSPSAPAAPPKSEPKAASAPASGDARPAAPTKTAGKETPAKPHAKAQPSVASPFEVDESMPPALRELALVIQQKEMRLRADLQVLKDGHPTVQRLRKEIAQLQSQLDTAKVQAEQWRAAQLKRRLDSLQAEESRAKRALEDSQNKMLTVTDVAVEYSILERQTLTARGSYDLIADKIRQLTMASSANDETARVLDAAQLGELVDSRNALKIAVSVFAAAVLAIALCFVLEGMDTTLKTPDDIGRYLGLPVVALIPTYPEKAKARERLERQRRKALREPESPAGHAIGTPA